MIARWTLKFHASRVGRRRVLGRALGLTLKAGAGSNPSEGTVGNTLAAGPVARVNAEVTVVGALSDWFARTGRFCVTTWPKIDPKTPRSKLRP